MEERDLMEMEQQLAMENDELIVQPIEEQEDSSKGSAVLATVIGAAAIGVSYIAYKKVVKPGLLKLAQKIQEKMSDEEEDDSIIEMDCEEVENDEE